MYLTKERLYEDIYLLKLKVNTLNCRIANYKIISQYERGIISKFYLWLLSRATKKFKYVKLRLYLLGVLKSFPVASQNILLKDYKDTSKLHLMLHQNESINKFKKQQKDLEELHKELSLLKIKINN